MRKVTRRKGVTNWEVTYSQYNEATELWWTGLKPYPHDDIKFTKYESLPYEMKVGLIVEEVEGNKYRPKRFEMEALVCTLVVKKGSAHQLEKEINKMLGGYRKYGYVISGFHTTPAYGVLPESSDNHALYLITQATLQPHRAKKEAPKETTTVVTDIQPLKL